MNVCTKFHANLSNSCHDILLKCTNVNFEMVLEKKSWDNQSLLDSSCGSIEFLLLIASCLLVSILQDIGNIPLR